MLLNNVPVVLLAFAALVAPGVVWAWRCYPSASRLTRLAVGLALGVAFQMHVCALLALGLRITRTSVWGATLLALALAVALAWRFPRRIPQLGAARRRTLIQGAQVALVVVVMAAVWTIPLAYHQIPQGWDPSFHSLLASVTVATGRLPSWRPFEPIASNYPYGPHVILAEISLLTGLAPDQVFGPLLNTVIPLLTGLAIYCFARRALHRHAAALAAVVAYGFLGNLGSIDYGRWGGLPNALGFFLLLVFLAVLFAPGARWTRVVVGGMLLGAIPLAHHHVMLTTVLLLGAYALYLAARLLALAITWRRQARRTGIVGGWRVAGANVAQTQVGRAFARLALTSGVALLTVAYYVIPFALRAGQLGDTSTLTYTDHFSGDIFSSNGNLLWALAALGMALLLLRFACSPGAFTYSIGARAPRWRRLAHATPAPTEELLPTPDGAPETVGGPPTLTPMRQLWSATTPAFRVMRQPLNALVGRGNLARTFAALASVALLLAFYVGYEVYRTYSLMRYHHPYTLFTPSRFLTDLTYFLAIFAGVGLAALWRLARWLGDACLIALRRIGNRWPGRTPEQTPGKTITQGSFAAWWGLILALALRCGLIMMCLSVAAQTLAYQIPQGGASDLTAELVAFAWVRDHTPQDTLVVNLDQNAQWAPYFTRREVYVSPIPVSEFVAGYIAQKQLIVGALLHATRQTPPNRLMALLDEGSALPALLNRPLAVITRFPLPGVAARYLTFHAGDERVYLLSGLFALTPYGPPPIGYAHAQWNANHTAFTLRLPTLANSWMSCQTQLGATLTLTLDGRAIRSLCSGEATNLPALAAPGLHTFTGQLSHLTQPDGSSRWFDLLLFTRHV